MRLAITVDTEKDIGFKDTCYGIDEGLPFILDIFKENDIKATFFISGQTADYLHSRGFVNRIVNDAHEIASHGYTHTDYREWEYGKIHKEILKSKQIMEELSGKIVRGYRAPQFLLNENVVKAVKESGFSYDSSMPDVSGISAAKILQRVKTDRSLIEAIEKSGLKEFPIDSIPIVRLPHGLLWINMVSFSMYKLLFSYIKKDFMIFFMHLFDVVKYKSRVHMDFKRKVFYLKNQNKIYDLLEKLIQFWVSKNVTFVTLEEELFASLPASPSSATKTAS